MSPGDDPAVPDGDPPLPDDDDQVHSGEDLESEDLGDDCDREEIDPAEVYTLEDFLIEDEKLEAFRRKIGEKLKANIEGSSSEPPCHRQRQSGPRRYVPRPREAGHDHLVANYFSTNSIYTDEQFHRRWMNKALFLRIVRTLSY